MDLNTRYSFRGWPASDYLDFFISIGSVFSAFLITLIFLIMIKLKNIPVPQEILAIPIGFGLFFLAYIWDSLAHRSVYKNKIDRTELVIHTFMIYYSGFPLFTSFVLAYWLPALMLPFIIAFLFMKTMYSLIDEARFHWPRFENGRSDMVELTAHCFQFLGNILYDIGFLYLIYWNKYEVIKALFRN